MFVELVNFVEVEANFGQAVFFQLLRQNLEGLTIIAFVEENQVLSVVAVVLLVLRSEGVLLVQGMHEDLVLDVAAKDSLSHFWPRSIEFPYRECPLYLE